MLMSIDRAAFNQGKNAQYNIEISENGGTPPVVANGPSAVAYTIGNGQSNDLKLNEISGTLNCMHDQQVVLTAFHITQDTIHSDNVSPCLSIGSPNGQATIGVNVDWVVRRLTPLECERLQGFPDYWTYIGAWEDSGGKRKKESSDSARYKAIGNSIALPPWVYVLQRLSLCCGGDVTMASLFDGIGGFPLIWERLHGPGFCLWASEIEEFPIAVTKRRFGK